MEIYAAATWRRVSITNLGPRHIWLVDYFVACQMENLSKIYHHVKSAWRTKLDIITSSGPRNLRQMPPARQLNQSQTKSDLNRHYIVPAFINHQTLKIQV